MKWCIYSIADRSNLPYFEMMKNSFRHFYPDIPVVLYDEEKIKKVNDPHFFYRATPFIAKELLEEYDLVIKVDADSVFTGKIDHIVDDETYDYGTVLNWNRVDEKIYPFPLTVWDVNPMKYMNCGFVAIRSMDFANHWWELCMRPNFLNYRFREQDLLNIIYHYGNFQSKCFDYENKWHGLIAKSEWQNIELKDNKLILPVIDGYPDHEKEIIVIHYAGGNVQVKMDFENRFKPEVAEHLRELTNGK